MYLDFTKKEVIGKFYHRFLRDFFKKSTFWNFCTLHKKTPLWKSLFKG